MRARRGETQSFKPWNRPEPPSRILVIRLHAIGDVALTLPSIRGVRTIFPTSVIDMLTLAATAPLLRDAQIADEVLEFPPAGGRAERAIAAVRAGLDVAGRHYDLIVDLQRNWVTRMIRRIASPRAWGEFDRFSPRPAAERVRRTFEQSGCPGIQPLFGTSTSNRMWEEAGRLLERRGYDPSIRLVVLNPAGLWKTRNWPVDRYVDLARKWKQRETVQFLLLGTDRIREAASRIRHGLPDAAINLAGETSLELANALLGYADVVISEDSGLMHLAWAQGIPMVALFGSSRHVWSAPTGNRVRVFHSGDLPCGQCMQPECAFGDVRCLSRWSADEVLAAALELCGSRTGIAA
jgi:heptosyltransferase II